MINWEMIRAAADHIEKELSAFDMSDFGSTRGCGTVGCVAGHMVWANDPEEFATLVGDARLQPRIETRAYQLLGVEDYHLFYGGNLSFEYINENKTKVPAALRWMAANERIDWSAAAEVAGFTDR